MINTYFEGAAGRQPKARRGHSKDKRTDQPLPALGPVLDAGGFVCRSQVFAGNVCEHGTPAGIFDVLNAPRGAPVVMDRAIVTEERICWLREQGYRHLVVGRERARHFDAENPVCVRTAANRNVHPRKVMSDDGREARPYRLSGERAARERGIVERFAGCSGQAPTEPSGGLPGPAPGNGSNRPGNASGGPGPEAGGPPGTTASRSTPTRPDGTPPPSASPGGRCGDRWRPIRACTACAPT